MALTGCFNTSSSVQSLKPETLEIIYDSEMGWHRHAKWCWILLILRGLIRKRHVSSQIGWSQVCFAGCDFFDFFFNWKTAWLECYAAVDLLCTRTWGQMPWTIEYLDLYLELWEPGSSLALQPHVYCIYARHAQWAFSHPLQAAVVLA